jgi:hypothetical protein
MITLEPIDTAPTLDLAPQEVATLIDELCRYHALYRPLFQRREQRDSAEKSLQGLLLELPRKSIELMILALAGADQHAVRAMQQFLSVPHVQGGVVDSGDFCPAALCYQAWSIPTAFQTMR